MILSTHIIAGAAVASAVPDHPVLGFSLGFTSHFVLDAIPHWDYTPSSLVENKNDPMDTDMLINKDFIFDLLKLACDVAIGFVLVFLLFGYSHSLSFLLALFAGTVGGILPDALQFLYFKWRHEPIKTLQKFHLWIHSKKHIEDTFLGVISQIAVVVVFILVVKMF